jgi:hypothetical protein
MGNYASVGASYTKQESDTKYPEKINVYSKTEDDEKFQLKGNYALKSDNNKLCVSDSENVTYCFDGQIVTKI